MRYLSLCSGIEAASVAWVPLGWRAHAFAEIEPFPSAVLAQHHPTVPNLGDMTRFREWPDATVDLLVGGTPCQSFSVAGLRKGLADPRGNLALTYLAIADRYRPEWLVWENVPGVLSSNGGRDFGAFLGGLQQLGYGFAYRVLDAQYVRVDGYDRAVPQRRRRVFVVGNLGDWRRAAAVLFEPESLSWDSPPRREAGQGIARPVSAGSQSSCGYRNDADTADNLIAFGGNDTSGPIDVATARNAHGGPHGRLDFESETFVAQIAPAVSRSNPYGDHESREGLLVAHALRADGFDASEDGTGRGTPIVPIAFDCKAGANSGFAVGDTPGALRGEGHGGGHAAVAFAENQRAEVLEAEVVRALVNGGGKPGQGYPAIRQGWAVRRLTPAECERLQGLPEISKSVHIEVCVDEKQDSVLFAETHSALPSPGRSAPVVAHVLIDLERQHLQLHSRGKPIWSASVAERPEASPLAAQLAGFARLAVLMTTNLARAIPDGKAASPQSRINSLPRVSGSEFARVSGREIAELAADAVPFTTAMDLCMKSITSPLGRDSPAFARLLTTSSCCAVAAISSFIPDETRRTNFAVTLESVGGYTLIPYRGKPAADGPRYEAIGNSMAVNVMRWIGRRIELVNALVAELAGAAA